MLKASSIIGSILVIIGLVIALLEAVIGFVGFLALAIKVLIVLVFLAVFASVGFLIFRTWQNRRTNGEW